ncbi:flagellin [Pseudomonas luteola]|uniref:flagellin N-terminal helical domain-containing protein n=1 Tax=Pseudomonas luteola TaxID=47886 RepID=UPI003A8AE22C
MVMSVNSNVASLSVQKNLNRASDALSNSMQRLSSGLKINSAKDDAAGLQIANRLSSQITGLNTAVKNANDGISIAQTAEGALQESTNLLQRMRELSLQAANGSNSDEDRASLNQEFQSLSKELTRIADTTTFGTGMKLLDGSSGTLSFQVGANANENISFSLSQMDAKSLKSTFGTAEASSVGMAQVKGDTFTIPTAVAGIKINSTSVAIASGDTVDKVAKAINDKASTTGVRAEVKDGKLNLSSNSDIKLEDDAPAGSLAGLGLAAGTTKASLTNDTSIQVNGQQINFTAGDDAAAIATKINGAGLGVTASQDKTTGNLVLNSFGKEIKLEDGKDLNGASTGGLAALGLTSGTTQTYTTKVTGGNTALPTNPAATTDYGIKINGTQVDFKAGDDINAVVKAINDKGIDGVTATKDGSGKLVLNSNADIKLESGSVTASKGDALSALSLTAGTTVATKVSVADTTVNSAADAQKAIQVIDSAIKQIDTQRSALGAVQNRFDSAISNLQSIAQNATSARSRVQDTDFAAETANMTKQQTLQQASTAVLAQANQLPSAVLKLLG